MPISAIMIKTALSLSTAVLGLLSPDYKIEKWTPVNSLTWGKAMAWDLRGNMDEEIERTVCSKHSRRNRSLSFILPTLRIIP